GADLVKRKARPLDVTAGSFVFHAQNDSSPTGLLRKSFSCNTYGSPRKCCELSTYKKPGGGPVMVNQLFFAATIAPWQSNPRSVSSISHRPTPTRSGRSQWLVRAPAGSGCQF